MYLTGILGGFFLNSTIPLFFEFCVEVLYPTGEGLIAG